MAMSYDEPPCLGNAMSLNKCLRDNSEGELLQLSGFPGIPGGFYPAQTLLCSVVMN